MTHEYGVGRDILKSDGATLDAVVVASNANAAEHIREVEQGRYGKKSYCARPVTLAIWSTWSATALTSALSGSADTNAGRKLTCVNVSCVALSVVETCAETCVRTITIPSRCPTPVPTCRSTSSGTFRGTSRSARAEEWLHITGARDMFSAASAVSSDVCERSTRTPRRLSSLTRVSPNGLCAKSRSVVRSVERTVRRT